MCSVSTEGAPPLRFLQGRAEMMPVLQDLLRSDGIDPDARAFPCPALHKEREGRGTHSVGDASKVKKLGHPPISSVDFAIPIFCLLIPLSHEPIQTMRMTVASRADGRADART